MMTKKVAFKALLGTALSIGVIGAAVMDPNTRMAKVAGLFTTYSVDAFKLLNGQDIGGTGGSEDGKASQHAARGDIANIVHSEDGNAFLFCVADSKWIVYQPEPMKIGTDATTMTDADGKPFVTRQIAAMRNSPNGKATIRYTAATPDGRKENREAIIWSSKNLLSRKNDTGQKFYCGTSIKLPDSLPNSNK